MNQNTLPSQGQKVEIRFSNGVFFDAIVKEWSDQKSFVQVDTGEVVIIQNTLRDVMVVKIYNDPVVVKEKHDALMKVPQKSHHELKNIAEARHQLKLEEARQLKEKFKQFHSFQTPGYTPPYEAELNYDELSRNTQIPSFTHDSGEKAKRTNPQFDKTMQQLFTKKH